MVQDMSFCCVNCFQDELLKDVISGLGVERTCDFCGQVAPCVDAGTLRDQFARFLEYYAPFEPEKHADFVNLLILLGRPESPLSEHIQNDWRTFSPALDEAARKDLIDHILGADDRYAPDSTWIPPDFSVDHVSFLAKWRALANHLKIARRFVIDRRSNSDLEEVQGLVQHAAAYISDRIPSGTEYFRARKGFVPGEGVQDILTGGQRPYERDEIGAPPKSATLGGGRINPPGFSFLHLASDRDTAVAEIRPAKGDLVSAALFKTTSDLFVADLTDVPILESPFEPGDLLRDMESRNLMKLLSHEFAAPVNPDVGPLEYVPTQYAAELFRDAGFRGVVYDSALGAGSNLVLFDPMDAEWANSQLVKVEDVEYKVTQTQSEIIRNMFEAAAAEQEDS